MLIMDTSVSGSKSRHTEVARTFPAALPPEDAHVIKVSKPLAPLVVSSLQGDEMPAKPVFVRRDKRDSRTFNPCSSAETTETSKRSLDAASSGNHSKKPLCSFEDE
jgi:hypothetical protein